MFAMSEQLLIMRKEHCDGSNQARDAIVRQYLGKSASFNLSGC
jgi:hypothetical protein